MGFGGCWSPGPEFQRSGGNATQIVDYLYDVNDRWIGESIDSDGDGAFDHETYFVYDGYQIVLQFDKDVSGATSVTGADLSHRYLWQPDAVDQLMADERTHYDSGNIVTDEVLWALTDQQGTVHDLAKYNATTGATAVVDHIVRDSFGKVLSESNLSEGTLIGATGRPVDPITGLRSHGHRWTDPQTADWLSKDPTGLAAGDTNTSRYCGNSPTNGIDPSGLWTIKFAGFTQPVHETIAFKAAANSYLTKPKYSTWSNNPHCLGPSDQDWNLELADEHFAKGLYAGSRYPDIPDGIVNMGVTYVVKDIGGKASKFPFTRATWKSHFGSAAFLHGMTPHDEKNLPLSGWGAEKMQQEIANWICDEYNNALTGAPIKDRAGIIKKRWGELGFDALGKSLECRQGFHLGAALHTLADIYCAGHVWRVNAQGDHSATGLIYSFQDYNLQDHHKHMQGDMPLQVNPNLVWSNSYFAECYNAAVAACTQLVSMFKAKTPVDGKGGVKEWLLNGPLKLAANAKCGPIDEALFGKTQTNGKTASSVNPPTALYTFFGLA